MKVTPDILGRIGACSSAVYWIDNPIYHNSNWAWNRAYPEWKIWILQRLGINTLPKLKELLISLIKEESEKCGGQLRRKALLLTARTKLDRIKELLYENSSCPMFYVPAYLVYNLQRSEELREPSRKANFASFFMADIPSDAMDERAKKEWIDRHWPKPPIKELKAELARLRKKKRK